MIAYFDCFSGISGDMILGALVDAGVPPEKLKNKLSCLPIKGYKLNIRTVKRAGLSATKVDVKVQKSGVTNQGLRQWKDIEKIIKKSFLPDDIKQKGLAIFKKLFEAEAKVHGDRFDKIHLHELGAVDCIIDIFGTLIGLDVLGVNEVYSSPVNLGSGTVKTKHGIFPVPAPATAELLRNVPVYSTDVSFELTTPTGAAIISSLASRFGSMPYMEVSKIGIGAGNKDFKKQPNVLRLFIGQSTNERTQSHVPSGTWQSTEDRIIIIETNIDDMTPQIYEYVMEQLFKAGALDVLLTQVIMKKGRPGIKFTVLCSDDKKEGLMKIMLRETTSIGLRFYEAQRRTLHREVISVETEFGKINVKISRLGDDTLRVTPEYEDCKKIAKKLNVPLLEVYKKVESSK
jgi:uncharacterized protein (TIGR00299 family) protein